MAEDEVVRPEEEDAVPRGSALSTLWQLVEILARRSATGEELWDLFDGNLRRVLAQAWLCSEISLDLANDGQREPAVEMLLSRQLGDAWPQFMRFVVKAVRRDVDWSQLTTDGLTEPLGADVDIVRLIPRNTDGGPSEPHHPVETIPFVVRLVDGERRIAAVWATVLPQPGWPPKTTAQDFAT